MLKLFIDDAGTHAGSPVVVAGGLIGNETQWTVFDIMWKEALARPFEGAVPLKKWSSGDCMRGDGEFERYKQAEKDLTTRRFRDVITKSGVYSASNAIDGPAWNDLITTKFGDKISSAEAFALFGLIDRLVPWASQHREGPEIAVFYDMGRKDNPEIKKLAGLLQDAATARPGIKSFTFAKVIDTTPLQGADMVATESYWFAQDFLSGKKDPSRAHFRAYLEDNFGKGNGMILDRARIEIEAAGRNGDGSKITDPAVLRALTERLSKLS
jgi:hypothetical protein